MSNRNELVDRVVRHRRAAPFIPGRPRFSVTDIAEPVVHRDDEMIRYYARKMKPGSLDARAPTIKEEPMKMYFYYPKYVEPENAAQVIRELLRTWEENDGIRLASGASSPPSSQPQPQPQPQSEQEHERDEVVEVPSIAANDASKKKTIAPVSGEKVVFKRMVP
ncbi:Type II secretion system (T2SS)-related protein GspDN3 [Andalucia godoyi]|uniref:Type II secretion system (T2SS)-related protein GspDN3 n=1 Tax=Andalucia godoyi TaxID=505711 RepID=A0A8K0AGU8_ANDGO|nr:Type II secretion system (T2SS)-related protein GspDN3 [Andalucia godoyi]|eukprot:ANDGO_05575.mRNA.1 Type II secretion system (T2SS)-related protein GspDN3